MAARTPAPPGSPSPSPGVVGPARPSWPPRARISPAAAAPPFASSLPPWNRTDNASAASFSPRAFRLTCFVEIVAAARFADADAVAVAYELELPRGGAWVLLADEGGRLLPAPQRSSGGHAGGEYAAAEPRQGTADVAGSGGVAPIGAGGVRLVMHYLSLSLTLEDSILS